MNDFSTPVEGRSLPAAWPFGSASVMVVSIIGFAGVMIDVYLVCRYWHTAPAFVVPILAIPIGVQLVYLWWRMLRYRDKIRQLYLKSANDDPSLSATVRVAAEGIVDVLLYSYGIIIVALILIGFLLSR